MIKMLALLVMFAIIILGMQSLAHVSVVDIIATITAQLIR